MVVLVTCNNDDADQFKNESTRVLTTFLPLFVYGDFSDDSPIQAFIAVLVTHKNE